MATAAQEKAATPPKPKVTVVAAAMKSVSRSETLSAHMQAVDRVDIVARAPGFVQKIGFEDGKGVASGEVLIEIEKDTYQAAITQIQGQIKSAQVEKNRLISRSSGNRNFSKRAMWREASSRKRRRSKARWTASCCSYREVAGCPTQFVLYEDHSALLMGGSD